MNRIRFLQPAVVTLAVALIGGAPALAQTDPTAAPAPAPYLPANPDADLLASEMRFLTQNPRDLRALLSAAEISTRLGDTSAALAFYARAEKIDPENPRIMAGRARVLVRLERPGEALALFQQAEARGLPMGEYLSDRGLAFDLLGAPHLAQRDYRAALGRGRDDETVRRYALSLGITGKYDEAMRELDPLLRRSDRASWRARAFILAMRGDFDGAERIAQSMMPGNMGLALSPFFRRLPALSVSDKAFAVHFGALTPTQARRSDAQLAPAFAAYVPERPAPPPPVAVAAVVPAPAPVSVAAAPAKRNDRRSRRQRGRPTEIAAATSVATRPAPPPPEANPLPPPPQYQAPMVQPIPIAAPAPAPAPAPTPTPGPAVVQVASVSTPAPSLPTMRRVPGQTSSAQASRPAPTPAPAPAPTPTPTPVAPAPQLSAAAEGNYDLGREAGSDTVPIAPAPTPTPAPAEPPLPPPPGPPPSGQEDSGLASIVGSITVPPEELAALEAPVEETPALAPAPATSRAAPVAPPASRPAATSTTPKPAVTAPARPARKAEPKPPPEPRRFWVQVGIGANERLLPTTWRKLVKDAPAAFKGKTGWWTPLRATNRLLTGPFKSTAEAQAFVNLLRKSDIDAYVFTSEVGQKVTKLEAK